LFLFIQIGNYLWNLVFHLGSQMGDETFYCLFFAFWFWNIDGAVGRRVMLTWTFIMYFGQVRLRARYELSVNRNFLHANKRTSVSLL
jgi:hypothetical protein